MPDDCCSRSGTALARKRAGTALMTTVNCQLSTVNCQLSTDYGLPLQTHFHKT
ncbi:MAG: hypothetical protein JGK08_02940 [Microcoleus sp. PH2017_04_SCI_O_A]|nr:hypothetical protein [Microcoleus sp. PH2017_04_SCI_O_A]MCC3511247.1 hypothetical protein [Microcoleus sp. PH2017_17_BER_D_A]